MTEKVSSIMVEGGMPHKDHKGRVNLEGARQFHSLGNHREKEPLAALGGGFIYTYPITDDSAAAVMGRDMMERAENAPTAWDLFFGMDEHAPESHIN